MPAMNWIALCAGAALAVVMVLTLRDPAGGQLSHRAFLAMAWPAFGLVGLWRGRLVGVQWNELLSGTAVLYAGILLATWFRPVLVMTDALPGRTRSDTHMMRRAYIAQGLVLALIVGWAAYVEFHPGA